MDIFWTIFLVALFILPAVFLAWFVVRIVLVIIILIIGIPIELVKNIYNKITKQGDE